MAGWRKCAEQIRKYRLAVTDLLFPRCCAVCGKELLLYEKHLCLSCLAEMPFTYFWQYQDNPAEKVFWGRVQVNRVYSLFYYTASYKKLIHSIKYKSNIKLGLQLGQMLGERIPDHFDCIIPVPLHYRKQWKRGFNQSHIIARGIINGLLSKEREQKSNAPKPYFPATGPQEEGETILKEKATGQHREGRGELSENASTNLGKIPILCNNILRRRHFTKTQTRKDRAHRWKNVEKAFALKTNSEKRLNLNGKHILLVDDVLTTGSTLDACCQLLLQQYSCTISIATLAYVE